MKRENMAPGISREAIRHHLSGPVASIRTPFNQDGSIDFDGLRNYVDFSIAAGSKTMLITAGDSLFTILSPEEIAEITKVVVEHTSGNAMVCAASDRWNTKKTVEFAKYCCQLGVDILMVLPPDWAHSCTARTFTEHYSAVAAHIPVMIVTNVFIPRGMRFGLETLNIVLQEVDGIVAIKDDMGGEFARRLALLVHDRWAVIAGGQKQNHLNIYPYGCDGYLSTFTTFKPQISNTYWEAIQSINLEKAKEIIRDFDIPFFDLVGSLPGGFDAGIHGVYELFGIAKRWRRKPYYSLNDEEMDILADFIKKKSLR